MSINFDFPFTEPEHWLKNSTLRDLADGWAPIFPNDRTLTGVTDWANSGTAGGDPWVCDGDIRVTRYETTTLIQTDQNAPDFHSPAGINPTSVTLCWQMTNRSGNNEAHLIGKTGSFVCSHPSTDNLRVELNGTEEILATDGVADIGGFNTQSLVVVRFTEGGANGTLDAWVNGIKVIDAVSTTETSLGTGSSDWFFGNNDHLYGEVMLFESAITDAEVDKLFGYWAHEGEWANTGSGLIARNAFDSGFTYKTRGPTLQPIEGNAGYMRVWGDGTNVLIRLKREVSSGVYGAWTEDGWSWSEDPNDLFSALTITVDGVEKSIKRMRRQSTPRSQNPNAAILDPHVTDNDFGTIGNYLEFSLVMEEPILMDSVVKWSITADVFTEGGDGNGAITNQWCNDQDSLEVTNFIMDRVQPGCVVTFVSKADGTIPKLADLEAGLTADHTYASGDTIIMTDINSSSNILFAIDLDVTDAPAGLIFEVGDQTNGGIIAYVTTGNVLTVVAGTGATRQVATMNFARPVSSIISDNSSNVTLGIHINGTQIDMYWEGVLFETFDSVDPSGWTAGVSDGRFDGAVNGDYIYSDVLTIIPTLTDMTLNELRVYENPTLAIALGSKDWYAPPNGINPADLWYGKSWESTYDAYRYYAADIADFKNPGAINACSDPEFARTMITISSEFAANTPWYHHAIMFKAGETWTIGTDTNGGNKLNVISGSPTNTAFHPDYGQLRGYYGTGSAPTFDHSANGLAAVYLNSNMFIEPGFSFIGKGDSTDGNCIALNLSSGVNCRDLYIGGLKFSTTGGSGFAFFLNDDGTASDVGDRENLVFGHMCFDQISLANSRGSALSIAGPDEDEALRFMQFKKSYWGAQYNGGAFSNQQSHGMYTKGWTPYFFIEGGWFPTGPGAMVKSDTAKDYVMEDVVGWSRKSSYGMHNNGTKDGTIWTATIDRTIRAGRHGERVLYQDFIGSDMDDYSMRVVSHVNSEFRRGLLMTAIVQKGPFFSRTGTSNSEGEYGGDSWYHGFSHVTSLQNSQSELQLAYENDRTLDNSYGIHYGYLNRCNFVQHDPVEDIFRMVGSAALYTYDDVHTSGGVTQFKMLNCNFSGQITDVDNADVTLAQAAAAWTAGGGVLDANTTNTSISFLDVTLGVAEDPLEEYFVDAGYANYAAVEAAIVTAWTGEDWSNLADNLQTERIRREMVGRMRPTNLTASDYTGNLLPGFVAPEVTNYSPAVGATGISNSITPTLQFDVNMIAGFGTIEFRRISDDVVVDSIDVRDCVINAGVEVSCTGINLTGTTGGLYAVVPYGAFVTEDGQMPMESINESGTSEWNFTVGALATAAPSSRDRRTLRPAIAPAAQASPRLSVGGTRPNLSIQNDSTTEAPTSTINVSPGAKIEFDEVGSDYEIRYTTNNTVPKSTSKLYNGSITLNQNLTGSDNTVIKARIFHKNNPNIKSRTTKIMVRVV